MDCIDDLLFALEDSDFFRGILSQQRAFEKTPESGQSQESESLLSSLFSLRSSSTTSPLTSSAPPHEAIPSSPPSSSPSTLIDSGNAFLQSNDLLSALSSYRLAIDASSTSVEQAQARLACAETLTLLKDYSPALAEYSSVIAFLKGLGASSSDTRCIPTTYSTVLCERSRVYFKMNRFLEALNDAEEALNHLEDEEHDLSFSVTILTLAARSAYRSSFSFQDSYTAEDISSASRRRYALLKKAETHIAMALSLCEALCMEPPIPLLEVSCLRDEMFSSEEEDPVKLWETRLLDRFEGLDGHKEERIAKWHARIGRLVFMKGISIETARFEGFNLPWGTSLDDAIELKRQEAIPYFVRAVQEFSFSKKQHVLFWGEVARFCCAVVFRGNCDDIVREMWKVWNPNILQSHFFFHPKDKHFVSNCLYFILEAVKDGFVADQTNIVLLVNLIRPFIDFLIQAGRIRSTSPEVFPQEQCVLSDLSRSIANVLTLDRAKSRLESILVGKSWHYTFHHDNTYCQVMYYYQEHEQRVYRWVTYPGQGRGRFREVHVDRIDIKSILPANVTIEDVLAEILSSVISRRQQRIVRHCCRWLYDILLKGLEDEIPHPNSLPNKVIRFIPDQILFRVPFGALLDSNGKYFVEKYAYAVSPSIRFLKHANKKRPRTTPIRIRSLICGNAQLSHSSAALSHDASEVESIVSDISRSGSTSVVLSGPTFVPDIVEAIIRENEPEIVHIAAHGNATGFKDGPSDDGLDSFRMTGQIRCSDDRSMSAEQVQRLKLEQTEILYLSACWLGTGQIQAEGVQGLCRAAFHAGCPAVVASLWPAYDAICSTLAKEFYRNYLVGREGKAESLRNGVLRLMEMEEGRFRDLPQIWGSFQLFGDPDVREEEEIREEAESHGYAIYTLSGLSQLQ